MWTIIRGAVVAVVLSSSVVPGGFAEERVAPARGSERAAAQFEVFLNFSDDACGRLAVVLEALTHRHPDDVRIVFRHLPPEHDPVAALPHQAAIAAERQDRFWEMARLLFANQDRLTREDVIAMAAQLQLDLERFTRDLDDPHVETVLDDDRARAAALDVASAPAVIVNGKRLEGERTLKHLETVVSSGSCGSPTTCAASAATVSPKTRATSASLRRQSRASRGPALEWLQQADGAVPQRRGFGS